MADVKFSELTTLAAADVATDDIFAVVDTSATTSKKLTVANLLGQVPSGAPLHINDTTDSTSNTSGAISTDGGLGVLLKSTFGGLMTVSTGIVPDESDGAYLGTSSKEFSDLFLADGAVISLGDGGSDTTLTHTADTGITLNSTRKLMFGDAASFVHQSADGVLTIDGEVTIDLNASGAVDVSNDLTLSSAAAVLTMGASPNQVTITHDASNGLTVGSTKKLMFNDASQFIHGSSATVMSIGATDEIDLTATEVELNVTTFDVNGAMDVSGLSTLGGNLTLSATNPVISLGASPNAITLTHSTAGITIDGDHQFLFRDAALGINSSTDGQLDIFADATVEVTLGGSTPTFAIDGGGAYNAIVKHTRDAQDLIFQQVDGHEVARIHDGATNLETGTQDLTAAAAGKGGFGFKRAVYNLTADGDDEACALTAAHSGSVIMVTGAGYDLDITLPTIAAGEEGWHCTIVVTTAFSGTNNLEIATAGAGSDNDDTIHLYTQVATAVTVDASGDTVISAADIPAGTMFELLAVKGGSAEQWICKAYQISGSAPTTGTAPA